MSNTVKDKAIGGFLWTLAEKFLAQAVSFVVSIILARLLMPEDYGLVAIVTVFTSIADVLVKSGLGSALIQKKDVESIDYSTVFFFNVAFSVALYAVIYAFSPAIATYYNDRRLALVLRVAAIGLVLHGINNVQQAYVSKNLAFKKFFFSTLFGTLVSAIVGIVMAFSGFGVWALVTQQLTNALIDTVFLHFTIGWKPTKEFSFNRLKVMYKFGWKVLVSDFITAFYNNITALIIGRKYTNVDLAYYTKGETFPKIIARNLDNSIQSVTFPILSKSQDDHQAFKNLMYRGCTLSFFFICPMMLGMMCVAEPLVNVLLTEKWLPAVPFLQVHCLTYLLRPIEATNLQAIFALGRSDITLKLDVIKKAYGIGLLTASVVLFDSPLAICASLVVSTVLNVILNMSVMSKLVGYGVVDQVKSILSTLVCSIGMALCCIGVKFLLHDVLSSLPLMVLQIVVGMFMYICFACLLKVEAFGYTMNYVKGKLLKKRV